ncbi:MAG: hypothetical protein D6736_02310 [Nitrospinota bacterium]|nr:MAG: hypothetical protein D6736_02310 [Nitrospinota bacterium]
MKMNTSVVSLVGWALLGGILLSSCSKPVLEQAFQGDLPPAEANKVINDYCLECHVHAGFSADQHLERSRQFYDRPPYTQAQECRVCHYIREEGLLIKTVHRGTRWPQWVKQGRFKRFEARELAKPPDQANP